MTPRRLRSARKKLGLSVARAAAQVHVTPRSWIRYESGETPVPDTVAHLFCMLNGLPFRAPKR